MEPKWFYLSKIPYEKMWIDDIKWLSTPEGVFVGEKLKAKIYFGKNGKIIQKIQIIKVESF